MGERLLLAIRDLEMYDYAVWLYNHWGGVDRYFLTTVVDIYVGRGLYKKKRPTARDWLMPLLEDDEFHMTGSNDDRNYLAAILCGSRTWVVWTSLYTLPSQELEQAFIDTVKEKAVFGEEFEPKVVRPLIKLVKKEFPNHLIFTLDGSIKATLGLVEATEKLIEKERQALIRTYGLREISKDPYFASLKNWEDKELNKLKSYKAKLVAENL